MLINSPNISGSLTVTGNSVITGSLTVLGGINATITGSATSASYVEYSNVANKPTLVSGSAQVAAFGFATTGSNQFNGSQAITGSLTVTGQVIAQTLNVQQVTSSIVFSSGSNVFGSSLSNTQQLTGSVSVTGSMNVNGTPVSVGTGASGQVAFWNGTSSQTGDNGLFWDNTNKRLGIGATTPAYKTQINSEASSLTMRLQTDAGINPTVSFLRGITDVAQINGAFDGLQLNGFQVIRFDTVATERWRINIGGVLQSNGAQTIQTSTGNLTLTSADNTGIVDIRRTDRVLGAELRLTNSFNGSGYLAGDIIGTLNFFTSDATGIGPHSVANITAVSGGENAASPDGNLVFSTGGYNVAASEKWRITSAGILQSNLAQTIQTSTGNLTLATAGGNGNIVLSPNGVGAVGIGNAAFAGFNLYVGKSFANAGTYTSIAQQGVVASTVTNEARSFDSFAQTAAASFTLPSYVHYRTQQATLGAGSAITNQYGFWTDASLIGATNNYGFFGNIAAGAGRWNLYMNGTANNYLAGKLLIGSTTDVPSASVAITSTTQGFLPPRMTSTQRDAIASPATGLVVYQTDGVEGLYVRTSTAWRALAMV
jgi:hypothetical protein